MTREVVADDLHAIAETRREGCQALGIIPASGSSIETMG